jgi:hypothetical protein
LSLALGRLKVVADQRDGDTQAIVLVALLLEGILHFGELSL